MHSRLLALRERGGPLAALTEKEIADLAAGAQEVRRSAGEVIMHAGEQGEEACLVLDGRLAATQTDAEGETRVLNEIGPGELAGEMELVIGGTRIADVRVVEDAWLAVLSRKEFEALLEHSPETWQRVTGIVEGQLRRIQLARHLRQLFGPFDPSEGSIPAALHDTVEFLTLASGDDLFQEGDAADCAYIVISGLLRVAIRESDGSERIINVVQTGETVGEMALLSGEPRSATVYAVRNSILARIPKTDFDHLIDVYPGAMKSLTRIIIDRLKRHGRSDARRDKQHTSIALVGARPGVPLDWLAGELARAFEAFGTTIRLDNRTVDIELAQRGIAGVTEAEPSYIRLVEWLHEQTDRHRYVIYQGDTKWSPWTERCVRQADHVVVVADALEDSAPGETEDRLPTCWRAGREPQRSLVLLHPGGTDRPRNTAAWLDARSVDAVYHLRRGDPGGLARLARILAGHATGLVLGGGGARGFAHLGVIRALEELGVRIDILGGASIGAPVAIPTAFGRDAETARQMVRESFSSLLDYTLPVSSLLSGRRITRNIESNMGSWDIEDLWLPFFCVSTNLTAARSIVHRRGNLAHAVRASVAIPGVLPPVPAEGDLLVDGGVLNNLPVDVMREFNPAGTVIAIDVAPPLGPSARGRHGMVVSGLQQAMARVLPWQRDRQAPGIAAIIMNSMVVGSSRARRSMLDEGLADFYQNIHVRGVGMLDFEEVDKVARIGYEESIGPLREWLESAAGHSEVRPPGG